MILVILIGAFVLRIMSLGQSFWLDEATSVTVATKSIAEILEFAKGDFHPPLYYLFLKFWISIFGTTEIAVRLLSVFFSVGTIYLTYKVAKAYLSEKGSIILAIFLTLSPLLVYYAQEARMYSQLAFFVALTFLFLIRKRYFLVGISLILTVLTDYIGILIVPAVLVIFLLQKTKLENILQSFIPLLSGLLAIAPLFANQFTQGLAVQSANPVWWKVLGGSSFKEIALFFVKTITGRIPFDRNPLFLSLLLASLVLTGFLLTRSLQQYKKTRILWIWLVVPLFTGLIVSFIVPIFSYFRFIFILPSFYILFVYGLANLKLVWQRIIAVVLLINSAFFLGHYLINTQNHREDWRSVVNFVDGDVYFVSNSQMEAFNWYAKDKIFEARGPEELTDQGDHIWVMRYVHDIFDPDDNLVKKVENLGYTSFTEYNFRGVVIRKYEKDRN